MFWAIVTIIVSARFGHILFFEPTYYLKHPFEVLMIRNGGLSFHGSVIGLGIYSYFFIRSKKVQWLLMADVLSIAGALGVGIGRIANFINQELYGKVTSSNYSVVFATVDKFQRHPTQIFESFFEGFLNFWTLFLILKFRGIRTFGSGVFVSVFCIIYSSSRFAIEFLKEVEAYNYFNVVQLTVGQVLSIIMFVFGISIKKMKYLTKKLIQRT
jgi:phosphatidylglycerol:prolipoprotein diacylglycerol transferase